MRCMMKQETIIGGTDAEGSLIANQVILPQIHSGYYSLVRFPEVLWVYWLQKRLERWAAAWKSPQSCIVDNAPESMRDMAGLKRYPVGQDSRFCRKSHWQNNTEKQGKERRRLMKHGCKGEYPCYWFVQLAGPPPSRRYDWKIVPPSTAKENQVRDVPYSSDTKDNTRYVLITTESSLQISYKAKQGKVLKEHVQFKFHQNIKSDVRERLPWGYREADRLSSGDEHSAHRMNCVLNGGIEASRWN